MKICEYCGDRFEKRYEESRRYFARKKYCSMKCYFSVGFSVEHKEKIRKSRLGKPQIRTVEGEDSFRQKMSGKNHPGWKGGQIYIQCLECGKSFAYRPQGQYQAKFCSILCKTNNSNHGRTPSNERIRKSKSYKAWRTLVFDRDNYTCVFCGRVGGYLHADHIKPFALHPELRLDVGNGRTLCIPCHKNTGTYGRLTIYRAA